MGFQADLKERDWAVCQQNGRATALVWRYVKPPVRYAAILFIPEDGIDRSELTHLERIHPAGWEENGWEVIEPFSVLPTRPCAECQGAIPKFSDAYLCGDCS